MQFTRKNTGVCSRSTTVTLNEQGKIEDIQVNGGCDGNLKGVCSLLVGMSAQDAIQRLQNIRCDHRKTSCPDQIALCLQEALQQA